MYPLINSFEVIFRTAILTLRCKECSHNNVIWRNRSLCVDEAILDDGGLRTESTRSLRVEEAIPDDRGPDRVNQVYTQRPGWLGPAPRSSRFVYTQQSDSIRPRAPDRVNQIVACRWSDSRGPRAPDRVKLHVDELVRPGISKKTS